MGKIKWRWKKNRGGERVQILRIYGTEKWRTRETCERKGGKGCGGDGAGMAVMGNRKKEIWEGLEEKAKTI